MTVKEFIRKLSYLDQNKKIRTPYANHPSYGDEELCIVLKERWKEDDYYSIQSKTYADENDLEYL